VTLSTTTLSEGVGRSNGAVKVASTSGLTPGIRLFIEGELMEVVSLGIDPWVNVLRGRDGTAGTEHDSGATIYIGRADQFYSIDPVGSPSEVISVSPYINTTNGSIWFAQGNSSPRNEVRRWWQKQSVTFGQGALGRRTRTYDPTSST
jgi:hypothetical protein